MAVNDLYDDWMDCDEEIWANRKRTITIDLALEWYQKGEIPMGVGKLEPGNGTDCTFSLFLAIIDNLYHIADWRRFKLLDENEQPMLHDSSWDCPITVHKDDAYGQGWDDGYAAMRIDDEEEEDSEEDKSNNDDK